MQIHHEKTQRPQCFDVIVSMLRRILELIHVSIKINKYIFYIILKIYFHINPMDFFLLQEMLINSGGDRRLVKAQSLNNFFL
jgi:hypothetical protein